LEEAEKGDFPWKALATAHMRSYLMQGVKGDRYHLENSKVAWVRALKSLKVSDLEAPCENWLNMATSKN